MATERMQRRECTAIVPSVTGASFLFDDDDFFVCCFFFFFYCETLNWVSGVMEPKINPANIRT